jgi:hypothetical protein
LTEGYDANAAGLEFNTAWVVDVPCPPRNGPSQNLAGMVNDARAMRATAVHGCSYTPNQPTPQTGGTVQCLIAAYGATAAAEIQRLRLNSTRNVYVVFDAGIGHIQRAGIRQRDLLRSAIRGKLAGAGRDPDT